MAGSDPQPGPRASRAGRDLPAAIAVGLGLFIYVVITLAWWPVGFIVLLVALTSLGTIEVHQALLRIGMRSAILPVVIGNVAIIGGSYAAAALQSVSRVPWHVVLLGTIGGTVLLALIWRMFGGAENYVKDSAASLFIIGYIPLLASFVGLILAEEHGVAKVVAVFVCVVASDVGGYAAGATLGRHAMAPNISPKKTWEGMAGSVALASVLGILLSVYVLHQAWWFGLLLAVVVVITGTAGDLIESLIKRDVGIKDMSSFLPGHGGVMDRLDSTLVAAPAAWLVFVLSGVAW
ncbi:phosphatidate cytidylyltransferase [Propionicimonas sp.]|uniref:phosphatidate cytidylyltransferase n=1 Tax=Propionicimonas sp. TaxID=1955623 RepID=UPI0039E31D9C